MWRNSVLRFGRVSRALHWGMALLIIAQLALGLVLSWTVPTLGTIWLYSLHKSLGFTMLLLVLARLIWHRISPVPAPLGDPSALPQRIARAVHAAMYVLLVVLPLSGWAGSSATGIDTVVFGGLTLPPLVPQTEGWETAAFLLHQISAYTLASLLVLHVAGALIRRAKGDRSLARMIGL